MQLDKTNIAVRERGILEILDMALHVMRIYAVPFFATFIPGAAPLVVLNYFLVGWMADRDYLDYTTFELMGHMFRYVWTMSLLVIIQAPLASVFSTAYLGQAVFQESPKFAGVFSDVFRFFPRIFWCHLVVRGILPACLLLAVLNRDSVSLPIEVFFFPALALYAVCLRAIRPFINEIVLLERNPLRSANPSTITIGRRSSLLHGPSGGDLFVQSLGCGLVGILLVAAIYGATMFVMGMFFNEFGQSGLMLHVFLPLSMWLVVGYLSVVRFLSYLDVRIRQEGWEVELKLRAEANRLVSKFA